MHYNFRADLAKAKETENVVAIAMSRYYKAEIIKQATENEPRWDFVLRAKNGRKIPIEVKEDFMANGTGNIAIEFFSRNKPSGIQTTQAQYYVYRIHKPEADDDFLLLRVSKLKKWIEQEKYHRTVNGGDYGSGTMMHLFRIDDIIGNGGKGFYVLPQKIFKGLI